MFEGLWQVDRVIHDHRAGSTGRFAGSATFSPIGAGLAYLETGQLWLDGHPPFKAERRYLWRIEDDVIHVDFDDGRAFHHIPPDQPSDRHWCDPDTYDVTYSFASWPVWHSTWDVSGPRKAYRMVTTYRREPPK
nr:DUF6314 family protein [Marivita sp. S6314]